MNALFSSTFDVVLLKGKMVGKEGKRDIEQGTADPCYFFRWERTNDMVKYKTTSTVGT